MKLTPPQYEVLSKLSNPNTVGGITNQLRKSISKNPAFSLARADMNSKKALYNYLYRVLKELQELGLVTCDKNHSTHIWRQVSGIEFEAPEMPPVQTELILDKPKDPRKLLLEAQRLIQEAMSQLTVLDKLREILK